MYKYIAALMLLVAVALVGLHYDLPNVIERERSAVVLIEVQKKNGRTGGGSGMVVGNGLILTASHVIEDANNVFIEFDDDTTIESSEFFTIKTIDAGLIIIENHEGGLNQRVRLKMMPPSIGDTVFTIGSPFENKNSVATGVFSARDRDVKGERLHQLDIMVNPGMSGCPVFNRYGNVVGMVTRGRHGIGFMVPSETCEFVIGVYEGVQRAQAK